MKTRTSSRPVRALAVGTALVLSALTVAAKDATTVITKPAASATSTGVQLSFGVAEVLKLSQAKVADDTILAFIRNSGNRYGLSAEQIVYLRQQGVSEAVLKAMLNRPGAKLAVTMPTTPTVPPAASTASTKPVSRGDSTPVKGATLLMSLTANTEPVATKVQSVPVKTYYYAPYYYGPPYYYPYFYYGYPPVSFSFGWGGGWGWGYHGGGYHGGGDYHGGGGHGRGGSHH